ncbi:SPFH domain-containing protein [Sulfobacillus harzensis]|uniref:SPFH domain-containing protein n=1 Tax=Sulfobacillus harzensis TaxID=2729629 RepID=A0A7Y0L3F5_9FIRM|nr:SPFH domain-containing protein [Sulfobacillus harzensis]NMP21690.1 SPFH domain-containing protein [Sulfobacillus harzensis]
MVRTQETHAWCVPGFAIIGLEALVLVALILSYRYHPGPWSAVLVILFVLIARGFFVVQPNESRVLTFFGQYVGSVSLSGWHWTNPFTARRRVSRRVRNFTSDTLKVNDADGNPVEIAAVVVWRIQDTAQAVFDVDDVESFVRMQAETAIRALAGTHPYDGVPDRVTLLGSQDVVAHDLAEELQERLKIAGVQVMEARLAHLAYAAEIAQAMLRRQQAQAIVAARQTIVDGALGMVHMALDNLLSSGLVDLDEERKASMVNNLMVVLASDQAAQPVVNAGTLYT